MWFCYEVLVLHVRENGKEKREEMTVAEGWSLELLHLTEG